MKALSALTSVKTLLPVKVAEEPIPIDDSELPRTFSQRRNL
jgi:hypothetical protein